MALETEAKKIEFQMNNYMRLKQKQKFKPSYFTRSPSHTTMQDIEYHVSQEIQNHTKKIKSWNSMLKCDRWNLIKSYIETHDDKSLYTNIDKYKRALANGSIKVTYDIVKGIQSITL